MTEIKMIKSYINDMRKRYPVKEGEPPLEPHIYYMNGNDGTEFDWDCNNRTCEFFVFFNSPKQLGYMKVYATKHGTLEGYVWDTERYSDGVELPSAPIGQSAARRILNWGIEQDEQGHYDEVVADL